MVVLTLSIRLLKDVNENSEEQESLVWFGLGLCGLSKWVNFRVRWVDVFWVLFKVGLKIALGFGCLVLIFGYGLAGLVDFVLNWWVCAFLLGVALSLFEVVWACENWV